MSALHAVSEVRLSHDLIDLALGDYNPVDLNGMTSRERYQLIQRIIHGCEPLKYFPELYPLAHFINFEVEKQRVKHNTPPGVLWVECPMDRIFLLAGLSRNSTQLELHLHEEGITRTRIMREQLFLDVHGRFVLWEEAFLREEKLNTIFMEDTIEMAEVSRFSLLSEGSVEEYVGDTSVTFQCIEKLFIATERHLSKRQKQLEDAQRWHQKLRFIRGHVTVGRDDGDDLPF